MIIRWSILIYHLSDDGEETTAWENEFLKEPEVSAKLEITKR